MKTELGCAYSARIRREAPVEVKPAAPAAVPPATPPKTDPKDLERLTQGRTPPPVPPMFRRRTALEETGYPP